ncbi:MAG: Fic family protein [Calditrichaeota bacterium]|nr:Fic family protein [Calditrichota bacterium]
MPEGFNPPLQDNGILRKAWQEHQSKLAGSESLREFNARLAREWSIETGIIERLYSIDRGTTQLLIERGIDAALIPYGATDKPPTEIVKILKTHEDVLQGLFDFVKEDRLLTVAYIRELHQAITRDQEWVDGQDQFGNPVRTKLIKGDWKQHPNNPKQSNGTVHEYCPPEHVQSEMERLIELHHEHAARGVSPEIQAAWLHHRFTQIHPFQDGNGRVARILASMILIKAGGLPFSVKREDRDKYLDALEAADGGELLPFVKQISELQTVELVKAIGLVDTAQHEYVTDIIASGVKKLSKKHDEDEINKEKMQVYVDELIKRVQSYYADTVAQLAKEVREIDAKYKAENIRGKHNEALTAKKYSLYTHHFLAQQGYKDDEFRFHNWVGIQIRDYRLTQMIIGFYRIGKSEENLLAVTAYLIENEVSYGVDSFEFPASLCSTPFVLKAEEPIEKIDSAFRTWVNDVVFHGLAEWQKRIR